MASAAAWIVEFSPSSKSPPVLSSSLSRSPRSPPNGAVRILARDVTKAKAQAFNERLLDARRKLTLQDEQAASRLAFALEARGAIASTIRSREQAKKKDKAAAVVRRASRVVRRKKYEDALAAAPSLLCAEGGLLCGFGFRTHGDRPAPPAAVEEPASSLRAVDSLRNLVLKSRARRAALNEPEEGGGRRLDWARLAAAALALRGRAAPVDVGVQARVSTAFATTATAAVATASAACGAPGPEPLSVDARYALPPAARAVTFSVCAAPDAVSAGGGWAIDVPTASASPPSALCRVPRGLLLRLAQHSRRANKAARRSSEASDAARVAAALEARRAFARKAAARAQQAAERRRACVQRLAARSARAAEAATIRAALALGAKKATAAKASLRGACARLVRAHAEHSRRATLAIASELRLARAAERRARQLWLDGERVTARAVQARFSRVRAYVRGLICSDLLACAAKARHALALERQAETRAAAVQRARAHSAKLLKAARAASAARRAAEVGAEDGAGVLALADEPSDDEAMPDAQAAGADAAWVLV